MKRSLIFASITILFTAFGTTLLAQGPDQGAKRWGQEDSLRKNRRGGALEQLNRALESAGAEALSSEQKECMAEQLQSFRETRPEFEGDGSGLALHQAYAQAILNNAPAAEIEALAEEMALVMAAHTQKRLMIQADLQKKILGCLTEDQLAALRTLDPKYQARLVGAGPGGFGFARGQRGDGARNRPGRN